MGVPELVQHSRAHELGSRVLGSLAEFVAARGLQMQIGVNIGIAIYPRDAQTSEALMQAARVSLAEARESGSNQVRVFNSAAGERARRMRVIRRDLWLAIQDDGLRLMYQPKFDVKTRRVVGAEALCRWRHPTLGAVNPAEFIMVARAVGPDRQARRLGDRHGLRAGAPVARRRAAHRAGGDQCVRAAFREPEFPAVPAGADPPARHSAFGHHAGDYRDGGDEGHRQVAGDAGGAAGAGHSGGAGRLRQRLFEPGLPEAAARGHAQDRPDADRRARYGPAGPRDRRLRWWRWRTNCA